MTDIPQPPPQETTMKHRTKGNPIIIAKPVHVVEADTNALEIKDDNGIVLCGRISDYDESQQCDLDLMNTIARAINTAPAQPKETKER